MSKEEKVEEEFSIKFCSYYVNKPKKVKQKLDNKIIKEYGAVLDLKTNQVVVKVVRTFDRVEEIQSFRDDVDLYKMIEKYNNGELVLGGRDPNSLKYEDVTNLPTDYMTLSDELQKIQGKFNNIGDDFKNKYNIHSLKDYIDVMLSGQLIDEKDKVEKEKVEGKQEKVEGKQEKVEKSEHKKND